MKYCRNSVVLALLFVLGFLQGTAAKSTGAVEETSAFEITGGIILLVCLIIALALCGGGNVAPTNPLPAWVTTIAIDPNIDKGIGGCSDGINIINPNVVHRHRTGHFETDGAKWAVSLNKGKHVFEIFWPQKQRGTLATVGVGSEDAPLFVKPRDSLVGCNPQSWGFDITRRKILHKGAILKNFPPSGFVADKFFMYVDCDSGTVGFGTEVTYWGAPIIVPRSAFPVYPMIGCMCQNAQITMIYRGSENRNNIPVQGQVQTVVVPSTMPGGATQVTVVNPGTVQMQHQQPAEQKTEPPPSYEEQEKQT